MRPALLYLSILASAFCPVGAQPRPAPVPTPAAQAPPSVPAYSGETPPALLSQIDAFLKVQGKKAPLRLHLCFPAGNVADRIALARGAALAEAFALRAGDHPVLVTHGAGPQLGRFNIWFSLVGEAPDAFRRAHAQIEPGRGFLALGVLAGAPPSPILYVVGDAQQTVDTAILSFGLVNQPLPEAATASIRAVTLPAAPAFIRQAPLQPNQSYSFFQLQQNGTPFSDEPNGVRFEPVFPADVFSDAAGKNVRLKLHFTAQQRGLGGSSMTYVYLNGAEVARIRWGEAKAAGPGLLGECDIPLERFSPGRNRIEVLGDPLGAPAATSLSLYGDSQISIPDVQRFAQLPDLHLTARTFFPFVGQPDGSEVAVFVTDRDPMTIDAAWTLLARFAQMSNTLFYAAQVDFTTGDPGRHQLVVGSLPDLPASYQRMVPRPLLAGADADYLAVLPSPSPESSPAAGSSSFSGFGATPAPVPAHSPSAGIPALPAPAMEGGRAVLASVTPPEKGRGWLLFCVAQDDASLLARVYDLVLPDLWGALKGSAAGWGADVNSLRVIDPYAKPPMAALMDTKVTSAASGLTVGVREWIAAVVVVLIVFVIITSLVVKRLETNVSDRKRKQDAP